MKKKDLVIFGSNTCAPCKSLKKVLTDNGIRFVDRNFDTMSDEERLEAASFRISSLPTALIMEEGKVKNSIKGFYPGIINDIKTQLQA